MPNSIMNDLNEIEEIDEQQEAQMPIIQHSSEYFVEEKLIYQYDKDTGTLKLAIDKNDYNQLLKNLGDFSNDGASFCFLLPQIGEVCFSGVLKIERIQEERSLIQRFTRIFRRRKD